MRQITEEEYARLKAMAEAYRLMCIASDKEVADMPIEEWRTAMDAAQAAVEAAK